MLAARRSGRSEALPTELLNVDGWYQLGVVGQNVLWGLVLRRPRPSAALSHSHYCRQPCLLFLLIDIRVQALSSSPLHAACVCCLWVVVDLPDCRRAVSCILKRSPPT